MLFDLNFRELEINVLKQNINYLKHQNTLYNIPTLCNEIKKVFGRLTD